MYLVDFWPIAPANVSTMHGRIVSRYNWPVKMRLEKTSLVVPPIIIRPHTIIVPPLYMYPSWICFKGSTFPDRIYTLVWQKSGLNTNLDLAVSKTVNQSSASAVIVEPIVNLILWEKHIRSVTSVFRMPPWSIFTTTRFILFQLLYLSFRLH